MDTPLHAAARDNLPDAVRRLGEASNGSMLDVRDAAGRTPLAVAAALGQVDVVAALLECGASTSIPDASGVTAEAAAASEEVRLLIHKEDKKRDGLMAAMLGAGGGGGGGDPLAALLAAGMGKSAGGNSECPF